MISEEIFFHGVCGRSSTVIEVVVEIISRLIHQFTSTSTTLVKAEATEVTHDLLLLLLTVDDPREGRSKCKHQDDKTSNKTTIVLFDFGTNRSSFFSSGTALETSGDVADEDFGGGAVGHVDGFGSPEAIGISLAIGFIVGSALSANALAGRGADGTVGTGAVGGFECGAVVGAASLGARSPVAARIGVAEDGRAVTTDLGSTLRSTVGVPVATSVGACVFVGDVEASLGVALVAEPHAVGVEEAGVFSLITAETRLAGSSDKSTLGVGQARFGVGVLVASNSRADATGGEGARFRAL